MMSLDAYHLGGAMTLADKDERNRLDRTCFACGFDDVKASGHDCIGYPEDSE